jgi:uncharacterized membrane protein YdjX (TVP38/TMEM64 family)
VNPDAQDETRSQPVPESDALASGPAPEVEASAAGMVPDGAKPPLSPWERLVDNLSTLALLVIVAVIVGGLLLNRLPERVQPWLVDQIYDDGVQWRTLLICALLSVILALDTVRTVGRERLQAAWATARRLGPMAILGAFWTAMPAINGTLLLIYMPTVAEWLEGHKLLGLVLYIVIFMFSAGFGMLPTYAQAILAGFVFGAWLGIPAALAGFVGAAIIGHTVARTVSKDRLQSEIAKSPKAEAVRKALIDGGTMGSIGVIALLRLPPNSPFALTNLVLAASGAKLLVFAIGTGFGMIPRTAAAVVIGTQYESLVDAETPAWMGLVGIGATIVVLAILGLIANHTLRKVVGQEAVTKRRLRPKQPSA